MSQHNTSDNISRDSNEYKSYVGPLDRYDLVGAMQFNLATSFGLRDHHKLLDIGCGSLRSGKLMIPYLRAGNYYGVEPNQWLIEEGFKKELGQDIREIKSPTFSNTDNFELGGFNETFDFIIAQSIFSHASVTQINKCLSEVKNVLKPKGIFLATFFLGRDNYKGEDWVYPGCVKYTEDFAVNLIRESGFETMQTESPHPNKQTWFAIYFPKNKAVSKLAKTISGVNMSKKAKRGFFDWL